MSASGSSEHLTDSAGESITKSTKRVERKAAKIGVMTTNSNCVRSMLVSCAVVAAQSDKGHNIAQPRNINVQWQVKAILSYVGE